MPDYESADRSPRPAPRPGPDGFADTVRDEFARLRGKTLGACTACGQPVFFEHSFTRFGGSVIHVRCPATARLSSRPSLARDH